jgi:gas vesicle protein
MSWRLPAGHHYPEHGGQLTMSRFFSFLAGAMSGAVVGATAALLLTPTSGEELRSEAVARWEEALRESREAMEQTRRELEAQFQQMKRGTGT